ncbi:hypothetical protein [Gulosibacter chungangensis]|uniref:Uncharacterized protein n=1 Tax=Gulosibacter chungangensis TaxID=979746 RepID=A0A7J5B9F3_9MICO|nr:hypothetical protein [Gulosibacter chungangensis]KAB1642163.1 hypothetical protein F8O05_10075 [Gulosibacter chungangensis]
MATRRRADAAKGSQVRHGMGVKPCIRSARPHICSAFALLATLLAGSLAGCTLLGSSGQTPYGQAVHHWVELQCEGRYSEANSTAAKEGRIDSPGFVDSDAQLLSADGQAFLQLSELRRTGSDVAPKIEIVAAEVVGDGGQAANVEVSGTCYGVPFHDTITAVSDGEDWSVRNRITLFQTDSFVRGNGTQFRWAVVDIPTGTWIEATDPFDSGWLLPPGEHTMTVPEHFLTGEPIELSINVSLFAIADDPPMITFHNDALVDAMAEFRSQCDGVCVINDSGVSESGVWSAEPLTITPLEVDADGRATYSGSVTVIRDNGVNIPWGYIAPKDWGLETPDTGIAVLDRPINHVAEFTCPDGEICTLSADEVQASGAGIEAIYFVAEGDGATVAGFRPE